MKSAANIASASKNQDFGDSEVSYSIIETSDVLSLSSLALAINVQLNLWDTQPIPFLPFAYFDQAKSAEKLFLYGPSGCGKSRAIYEIIKDRMQRLSRFVVINPRRTVGDHSDRKDLAALLDTIDPERDAVIWDNFPDDSMKRDRVAATGALEILVRKDLKNLLVALKPAYLELYRGIQLGLPEMQALEISFNRERMTQMLNTYGQGVAQFRPLWKNYIESDADKISRILWQKEPTPMSVLGYYNDLKNKEMGGETIDAIRIANSWLRPTDYYRHQFQLISSIDDRRIDAEFLCTVKLCYELGLHRTIAVVELLQKGIFGSNCPFDPLDKLGVWVYLSGQYYGMHDVCRNSIKFSDHTKSKILAYITDNFLDIAPPVGEESRSYDIGLFVGQNLQFLIREEASNNRLFLTSQMYDYMKTHRYFETGLGHGLGECFPSLETWAQDHLLTRVSEDFEFARCLGESLGSNFARIEESRRQVVLMRLNSIEFARGMGKSLGRDLLKHPAELQQDFLSLCSSNFQFARGLGTGIGQIFYTLHEAAEQADKATALRESILRLARENIQFAIGLGSGMGQNLSSRSEEFVQEVLKIAETNSEFARGVGEGIGSVLESLDDNFRRRIFDWSERNPRLADGLGYQIGYLFSYFGARLQQESLCKAEKNVQLDFGIGIGLGHTFTYLDESVRNAMLDRAERNAHFAQGLGSGLGFNFHSQPDEFKKVIEARAVRNLHFGEGMGIGVSYSLPYKKEFRKEASALMAKDHAFSYGLGIGPGYQFEYLPDPIKNESFALAQRNSDFARGLGVGLGINIPYRSSKFRKEILDKSARNAFLARGLGFGIAYNLPYHTPEFKQEIFELAKENGEFARGLGTGAGHIFGTFSAELRQELFRSAHTDPFFAFGLGYEIGNVFSYLDDGLQEAAFDTAIRTPNFARGLGCGLGYNFRYLHESTRARAFVFAATNMYYAVGLSQGLGLSFKYLDRQDQSIIISRLQETTAFAQGLGIGMGHVESYLDHSSRMEISGYADRNMQFAVGLGIGVADSLVYSEDEIWNAAVFDRALHNSHFAEGLGIGLGQLLCYCDDRFRKQAFTMCNRSRSFAQGLGAGLGHVEPYLDTELREEAFRYAEQNAEFARGLGIGIAVMLPSFDRLDSYLNPAVTDAAQYSVLVKTPAQLQEGLGFGIGYNLAQTGRQLDEYGLIMSKYSKTTRPFARGLGFGLGYCFPSLGAEVQDSIFAQIEKSGDFARGLGNGLSRSFRYLDANLRTHVESLARQYKLAIAMSPDTIGDEPRS